MSGLTKLQFACYNNDTKRVRKLLVAGGNVNDPLPLSGLTPLMIAVFNENIVMVKDLLKQVDIKLDAKSYNAKFTALEYANIKGNMEIIRVIKNKIEWG